MSKKNNIEYISIFNSIIPQPKCVKKINDDNTAVIENGSIPNVINIYVPNKYEIYKYDPSIDDVNEGVETLIKPLRQYSKKINIFKYENESKLNNINLHVENKIMDIELFLSPPSSSSSSATIASSRAIDGSYTIKIKSLNAVQIIAPASNGLFYGIHTLSQMFQFINNDKSRKLPTNIEISDYPSIENRGVMLDITRGRVPTMNYIKSLIEMLASFKYNQLQLYCEHAFAYKNHPVVWKNTSPITSIELHEIDTYCALHHIKLVASQNTLGHMHRWLKHEEYKHLAECPNGNTHPFSLNVEPYSLNVTDPKSFQLSTSLIDEMLLSVRTKDVFNVNLDEVFDLGLGRSNEKWKEVGTIELFLDYLTRLQNYCAKQGIDNMMSWGDFYHNRPETVQRIPKKGVTILEWGYDDWHPFLKNCKRFEDENVPFYVCPGTSSWGSFAGRTKNMVRNLHFAAIVGQLYNKNCKGFLMTDWGDLGCPNPPSVSYLPYVVGADASWGKFKGGIQQIESGGDSATKQNGNATTIQLTGENDMPTMLDQNWTCTSNIIFNTLKYIWEHLFLGKFFISTLFILPGIAIAHVLFFVLAILLAPFGHRIMMCGNYDSYIKHFNSKYNNMALLKKKEVSKSKVPIKESDIDIIFNDETTISNRYIRALNLHVFKYDTTNVLGRVAYRLGNAYLKLGYSIPNGTLLFWGIMMPQSFFNNRILKFIIDVIIAFPLLHTLLNIFGFCFGRFCGNWLFGITENRIAETKIYLDETIHLVKELNIKIDKKEIIDLETILVVREMEWVTDVLKLSCDIWLDRLWVGVHVPLSKLPKRSKELKLKQLNELIERHKKLWVKRSRPGGLEEWVVFLNVAREMMRGIIVS
eukprot:g6393.t1